MTHSLSARAPKQLRSRQTLERIVRASLEILQEGGPERLTVQAVVERAGSSVGSFYARFDGKEELLAYLGQHLWKEAATRWAEVLKSRERGGRSLTEVAEEAVRLLDEALRTRATYLLARPGSSGAASEAATTFEGQMLRDVERILLACRSEIGHPDPELAVRLGLRGATALLEDGRVEDQLPELPRERRIQEAFRLIEAYLAGGRAGQAPSSPVEFFDIWS